MIDSKNRRWWGVAGLFGVLLISSGFGFYNLSVYVKVFADSLHASVSEVSVLVSLFFITGGVAGVYVARLMERWSIRTLMLSGAALSGVSLALCGLADALWQLWILFVLFGFGNAGVSIVVSTSLIARWFPGPNRAIALSIASTGLSVGGVVITPISALALEQVGVAAVMPWLGAAFFFVIAPLVIWLIDSPTETLDQPGADPGAGDSHHISRQPFYLLHTLSYLLIMAVQVGGIAHLYSRAEEIAGFTTAAFCVQLLSGASIVARFLGGWLLTRISAFGFTVGNLCLQTVGIAMLAQAQGTDMLIAGSLVFGASVGNLLMLQPLQLAEVYGAQVLARVFALANAITLVGVAGGPLMFGVLRDFSDYSAAYSTATVVSVLAIAVLLAAGFALRKLRRETE